MGLAKMGVGEMGIPRGELDIQREKKFGIQGTTNATHNSWTGVYVENSS